MKFHKSALILSLLLLPTIAYAQSPSTEVALKVTLSEAEILWKALRKLPVDEVELLMAKVRQQVAEQTQPKTVDAPKPVEAPKPNEDKKDAIPPSKP